MREQVNQSRRGDFLRVNGELAVFESFDDSDFCVSFVRDGREEWFSVENPVDEEGNEVEVVFQ